MVSREKSMHINITFAQNWVFCSWIFLNSLFHIETFRSWHIDSNSFSGRTIETTGWSIFYPDLSLNLSLHPLLQLNLLFNLHHLCLLQLLACRLLLVQSPLPCLMACLLVLLLEKSISGAVEVIEERGRKKFNLNYSTIHVKSSGTSMSGKVAIQTRRLGL